MTFLKLCPLLTTVLLSSVSVASEEIANKETSSEVKTGTAVDFGGPASPRGLKEQAEKPKTPAFRFPEIDAAFKPWQDWKKSIKDDHGFSFNGHYAASVQGVNDTVAGGSSTNASGVLRLTGIWEAVNRGEANTGSLVVTLDHRHAYTDNTPQDLAGEIGYIGITNLFFSDMGAAIINLNWQQRLNDGNTGFIVGRYDPNDYQNVLGIVNPWTLFTNLEMSLDVSVALPDSSWGIGAGHWLNDQFYVLGGVNDANGLGSDNLEFFEGGSELYKYVHVGWSPAKNQRYFQNVHVLYWDVDERVDAGLEASSGFAIGANWMFEGNWMPYLRLGKSEGSTPIYNKSATLGVLKQFSYRSDVVGAAITWGELPYNAGFTSQEQTSAEVFWQIQFSQNLEITPNIQYIMDPAMNVEGTDILSMGVRALFTF